ncbi:MAG: hypothetical protein COV99_04295 [Bacteroidetes bacterium CG12_big_fil_rev_8_21_14_0_65_60_17]|nr:MAG: hypothetical protein COV99_04295 [Bacteroidetes bacterium CG12_big_fil_rev_8_21_14_0_65_60_17]
MGLLAIGLFGIRSLVQGKINPMSMILTMVPIALLVILGLIMDSWAEAAVMAFLISLGLTAGALLLSGVRGLFG